MKLRRKKAISVTVAVLILFALVAGLIGFLYVGYRCYCGGGTDVKTIQITSYTFYSTSKMFNFTLNDPDSTTTISSVFVNQSPCNGNFLPIIKDAITYESCIASGTSAFTKGENVNYTMSFANGQSITGAVQAQ